MMATAGVSAAGIEVLQSFGVDLKDFARAKSRYADIVAGAECGAAPEIGEGGTLTPGKLAATRPKEECVEHLHDAWREYVGSVQDYVAKVTGAIVAELLQREGESSVLGARQRAEKLSELCAVGEKWHSRHETLFHLPSPEEVGRVVARTVVSSSRLMRLLGLHAARLYAFNAAFTTSFMSSGGEQAVGLCFDREHPTELTYALSYVERLLTLADADPVSYPSIPFGWVYRLASMLDASEQLLSLNPKHRSHAIRIALRMLSVCPAPAAAGDLHRLLLRCCIVKGGTTAEETETIVWGVLGMFDNPLGRQYMRLSDISVLYEPFVDSTAKLGTPDYIATMNAIKEVLSMLMSTWVGLLWVATETIGLRTLVDLLHLPGDLDRKMVIMTLFNKVLRRLAPHRGIAHLEQWNGADDERRRRMERGGPGTDAVQEAVEGTSPTPSDQRGVSSATLEEGESRGLELALTDWDEDQDGAVPTTKAIGYHILDPILGRFLLIIQHHGLPHALISILQAASNPTLALAAATLLQDIMVLMDTVLPSDAGNELYEALNAVMGRLAHEGEFFLGGLTSRLLRGEPSSSGCVGQRTFHISGRLMGPAASDKAELLATGDAGVQNTFSVAQQTSSLYGMSVYQVDDDTFMTMLKECNVELGTPYCSRWNFDLLLLLTQGLLRNLTRLRWVRDRTRFFTVLVPFYLPISSPSGRSFHSLRSDEVTPQMGLLGLCLVDLLLATREGAALLDRFGYTQAIGAVLADVCDGRPGILNRENVNSLFGQVFLRTVGRFTVSANGLLLMRERGMFVLINRLYASLTDERVTRMEPSDILHDVCYILLRHLFIGAVPNYGVCDEIRGAFRSALANEANAIRLCAVTQLRKALWRDLSTSMHWGIETLLHALHDDYFSVVECAFKQLVSICLCSTEALDYLISLSPAILMESEVLLSNAQALNTNALMYCIVRRPAGFRFLQCYGWVEHELRRWEESESVNHVMEVERMQSIAFSGAVEDRATTLAKRRHNRTYSEQLGSQHTLGGRTQMGFAPVSGTPAEHAGYFPVHFAAAVCCSNEGCNFFKHSTLWNRSIRCILQQPLPSEDILYGDDTAAGEGETMAFSDGMAGVKAGSVAASGPSSTSPRSQTLKSSAPQRSSWWRDAAPMKDRMPPARGVGPNDCHMRSPSGHDNSSATPLTFNETVISAARGYIPRGLSYSISCVGSILDLKEAILCVSHAGSSDVGFALVNAIPHLLPRLLALSRFASTISIRSISLTTSCLLSRSQRACAALRSRDYYVLSNPSAYVSADGVPYSVAFAHMRAAKWMTLPRQRNLRCSPPTFAYAKGRSDAGGVPRRIRESLFSLSNPVNREAAKQKLFELMKRYPLAFLEPSTVRLILDASDMYRMRHAERKYIAGLIDAAKIQGTPSSRKAG